MVGEIASAQRVLRKVMRSNLRLLEAPPSHLEHESPFQSTAEDAWALTKEIENHDPWMNWGDIQRIEIPPTLLSPITKDVPQFVQFDLPRPAVVQLRLSAISPQAAAGLTVDWQLTIGVGRAAQVRHVPQVVQAVSSNADLLFQFPVRELLIAARVTSNAIAATAHITLVAQAAPFYSGADVGVVPTGRTR